MKAFFIFLISTTAAAANFYENEIQPVLKKSVDTTSLQMWGAGLGSSLVARTQDDSWRDQWRHNQKMSKDDSHRGDVIIRNGWNVGGAILQRLIDPENGDRHLKALAFTALNTWTLKGVVGRGRPHGGNHHSFPSGHTSSAFASATALSYSYGWKAAVLAYPIATAVGLSRTADDAHWLSDVVAGAWIGVIWGRASAADDKPRETVLPQASWSIAPWMEGEVRGLQFVYIGF